MDEETNDTGYQLKFDKSISNAERDFYNILYPQLELVIKNVLHCTTCNKHIGTAPNNEPQALMHPVLFVTQCLDCYTFYTSGEFIKGEDGSELYCRWCGQGGEVYCCAKCPYVFCKQCITKNISRKYCVEVSENDNWNCFSCDSKVIWNLRAQQWALSNYMAKQIYDISKLPNDDDRANLMSLDLTTCCESKKRSYSRRMTECVKASSTAEKTKEKKSDVLNGTTSPRLIKKRKYYSNQTSKEETKTKPVSVSSTPVFRTIAPAPKTIDENEVVCTPDILSMLNNSEENLSSLQTQVQTPPQNQIVIQTPPTIQVPVVPQLLVRRVPMQFRPTQIRNVCLQQNLSNINSNTTVNNINNTMINNSNNIRPIQMPVYHTINGYRVDLNSAAQQETFRLPNGKVIQVKKHNSTTTPLTGHTSTQFPSNINSNNMTTIVTSNLQQQAVGNVPTSLTNVGKVTCTGGTIIINRAPIAPPKPALTPIENSLNDFDKRLETCKEICQHIIGKITTLRNTNQFKTASKFNDCKNLHIHLTYLCKYAVSRFKTLQDKCNEDIEIINKLDPPDTDIDNDDLEIVEPHTTLINLDSDIEDDEVISNNDSKLKNIENNKTVTVTGEIFKNILIEDLLNKFKDNIEQNTLDYNIIKQNVIKITQENVEQRYLSDSNQNIEPSVITITDVTNVIIDETLDHNYYASGITDENTSALGNHQMVLESQIATIDQTSLTIEDRINEINSIINNNENINTADLMTISSLMCENNGNKNDIAESFNKKGNNNDINNVIKETESNKNIEGKNSDNAAINVIDTHHTMLADILLSTNH